VKREEGPGLGGPLEPRDWLKILPHKAATSSDRLGWVGLEAARVRAAPASELNQPAVTHHWLFLVTRPPEELDLRYEGVKRHVPHTAGTISLVPAGTTARLRCSGRRDLLQIRLEARLVARVAAESLANVLAVHLIRHALALRRPARGPDGALPRGRLRAVDEYVEEHLGPGHFARQFKRATGLPPHQYGIARRVERARQLLQTGDDISLAELAAHVGFSDQSQFSHHFKRLVGVTPGQFRTPARIA
jgi:AraC-like DNA-binding protein